MAKQTINTLKSWFNTGVKPLQQQFWDWMDSYWHKDEKMPVNNVDGLTDILNSLPTQNDLVALREDVDENKTSTDNLISSVGQAKGIATLDNNSRLSATQLPSFLMTTGTPIATLGDIVDENTSVSISGGMMGGLIAVNGKVIGIGKLVTISFPESPFTSSVYVSLTPANAITADLLFNGGVNCWVESDNTSFSVYLSTVGDTVLLQWYYIVVGK